MVKLMKMINMKKSMKTMNMIIWKTMNMIILKKTTIINKSLQMNPIKNMFKISYYYNKMKNILMMTMMIMIIMVKNMMMMKIIISIMIT